jgi:hypothetical protein
MLIQTHRSRKRSVRNPSVKENLISTTGCWADSFAGADGTQPDATANLQTASVQWGSSCSLPDSY